MKMLQMCLNPKVLAALAVTAGLIFLFAPNAALAALPLLLLAACPLSMLLMGGMMMQGHHEPEQTTSNTSMESGHRGRR